jgi:hypothetical protein
VPHFNLGNALRSQGKLDQTIASDRKAVAVGPEDPLAYS